MTDTYSAFAPTSVFTVGPHSRLSRNGIVFNDRSGLECYWIEDFQGFSAADLIVSAQNNVQEDGELPDQGFYGGRTMSLAGWIQAGNYPALQVMERALLDSLIDLVELPLTISVAPGGFFHHPDMTISCRPIDKPLIDKKIQASDMSGVFKRNITIALRASTDPFFVSTVQQSARLTPIAVAQFGRTYPRSYPLAYNTPLDPTYDPLYHPDIIIAHTDGNYESRPIIRFNGGLRDMVFTNQTNGHVIRINGTIAAGDYIEVDIAAGTVKDSLGNDKTTMLDTVSDWLQLQGKRGVYTGDNTLAIQTAWFDDSGSVDVFWRDTYASA